MIVLRSNLKLKLYPKISAKFHLIPYNIRTLVNYQKKETENKLEWWEISNKTDKSNNEKEKEGEAFLCKTQKVFRVEDGQASIFFFPSIFILGRACNLW